MRFCPFCSADNGDDATQCASCSRRLPPLPPRRQTPAPVSPQPGNRTELGLQSEPSHRVPAPATQASEGRSRRPTSTVPPPVPVERSKRDSRSPRPDGTRPPPAASAGGKAVPPVVIAAASSSLAPETDSALAPPPTRTVAPPPGMLEEALPAIDPIPEVPEGGVWAAMRYAVAFAKARWQRRKVIAVLREQIKVDTTGLDGLLLTLGQKVRSLRLSNRIIQKENDGIDAAEARRAQAEVDCSDLGKRQGEEHVKFGEIELERTGKVSEAEVTFTNAEGELEELEAQRRGLRDKRKAIERQQKGYLKAAGDREAEAGKLPMGDQRALVRRSAEELRREAAALDPERQDVERRLAALDKPLAQATAKVEALKAELDAVRRTLQDAREGHRHRLAEIDAEQGRKGKELQQADNEIQRRLVTLGTLVNLNRIERPEFDEVYGRIDVLRNAIAGRSREVDRLTAEREAYDKGSLTRGGVAMGLALVAVIGAIVLVVALL